MHKKMIFFDIDGTLVPEGESYIPESAYNAIKTAQANGHLTFINTGRTAFNIDSFIRALNFDGYICGCGTYIYYRDKLLLSSTIPHPLCVDIIHMMRKCKVPGFFEENSRIYFDLDSPVASIMEEARAMFGTKGYDMPPSLDDPHFTFDKILAFFQPDSDYETFRHFIDKHLDFIDRGDHTAEIIQKGYSKATGIQFMCDYLHIPLGDCYVIGDSTNDLSMLQYVPNSIAMGNSTPSILPACAYQTTDILDDGIYNALKHYGII